MIAGVGLVPHVSWPYLRRHKLRTALATISVALAVALIVATRATDYSIVQDFEQSTAALLGPAQYSITHGLGVEQELLSLAEGVPGVRAAPVIQRSAIVEALGITVTVLGIDYGRDARMRRYAPAGDFDLTAMLLNPRAVIIPRRFAEQYAVARGGSVALSAEGGAFSYNVAGILRDEGPAAAVGGRIVVMSIAAAQELFASGGRVDRIDIVLDSPAAADALRQALPAGCSLDPAPRGNAVLDYSLAQMRMLSLGITLVALMIGLFIVYNSVSLSVAERSAEMATLRALGARRRDVVALFVTEALAFGLPASVAGVGLGVLFARQTLRQAATNINVMVQTVQIAKVQVPWDAWLLAPLVGVATAVLGSFAAARAAARVSPAAAGSRSAAPQQDAQRQRLWRWLIVSVPLGTASVALILHPRTPRPLAVIGFGGAVLALALALPQIMLWLTAPLRAIARARLGIESYLAFDNVAKFPARTSLTVVAFAGSLAVVVTVSGMLHSFQAAIGGWMDEVFAFDLSIQANALTGNAYNGAGFPEALIDELAGDPRIAETCPVRGVFEPYRGRTVLLIAFDVDAFARMQARRANRRAAAPDWRSMGLSADAVRNTLRSEVAVSSNFARLYGVRVGDRLTLAVPGGERQFDVIAQVEDYSWPFGVILTARDLYVSIWHDRSLSYLDIQARDPADVDALQADLTRRLRGRLPLYVHKTAEIKAYADALLRDWFRLADAQVWLAIVIGAVGVANTLLVSVLSQSRQIGLLRAVGATRGQVQRVLAAEAALLGTLSAALGIAMGFVLAAALAPIFIARESGYRFPFVTPWSAVLLAGAGGIIIALLASLLPIRAVRRLDIVRAIGME